MKRNKTQMLLRWPRRLMRITGTLLLGAYLVSVVDPVMANVRAGEKAARASLPIEQSATELFAERLGTLEELLDRMHRRLEGRFESAWQETIARSSRASPPAAASRADLAPQLRELDNLASAIADLVPRARVEAEAAAQAGARSGLPAEMQARQASDRMSFEEGVARLVFDLDAIRSARDDAGFAAAVAAAHDWLRRHSSLPARAKFDPDKLAFGSRNESSWAPATDAAGLARVLGGPDMAAAPDYSAKTEAGGRTAPTPADLAPTEDVQLTPAIRSKAQELGGTPLALFRYVHDTMEFVPSYGSIQGSDYTLQLLKGNAFDQASLLIALLRASGIPARYVYGTVDIPIEQAMNWVGGVESPMAVLSLMSQGGIPNTGLTEGGVIKHLRLEHVWVEAWTNQWPGAGMRGGLADSWVALDPSFKQYQSSGGMDIATGVPMYPQAFLDHINANATVNDAEGWTQGVDGAYVMQEFDAYRQRLRDYVETRTDDPTFGSVLGARIIRALDLRGLPAGLPYQRVAEAEPFSAIAGHLRWRFRFSLGETSFGDVEPDTELVDKSLPSLAGRALALSFRPATPADEHTLRSYVPANVDGPEDLPATFPANVVRMATYFSIDGQDVASGPVYGFGAELMTRKGLYSPARGWEETDNPFTVGDYQAIGLSLHGVSKENAERRSAEAVTVREKILAQQVQSLSAHDLTGTLLQNTALSYFVRNDAANFLAARAHQMVSYVFPSYGTVSSHSRVAYLFGVPRLIRPGGVLMDMDRIASIVSDKRSDPERRAHFQKAAGQNLSSLEGEILEKAFSRPAESVEAVSAAKLLTLANQAGQRIYTITAANAAMATAALNVPGQIKADIADAVAAGKTVRIHQSPLTHGSQQNVVGYTVIDPETGAGAYLISSNGADGGEVKPPSFLGTIMLILAAIVFVAALIVGSVYGVLLLIAAVLIAGCGVAAMTGNGDWFDDYKELAMALFGALLVEGGVGAIVAAIIALVLAIAFNHLHLGAVCEGLGRWARARRPQAHVTSASQQAGGWAQPIQWPAHQSRPADDPGWLPLRLAA